MNSDSIECDMKVRFFNPLIDDTQPTVMLGGASQQKHMQLCPQQRSSRTRRDRERETGFTEAKTPPLALFPTWTPSPASDHWIITYTSPGKKQGRNVNPEHITGSRYP